MNQVSMNRSGVNISSDTDITAMLEYDGTVKWLKVFVFYGNDTSATTTGRTPVISMSLNLSNYLPDTVYFGFSASTGNGTELNCIRAWSFNGDDVDSPIPYWVWVIVSLCGGVVILVVVGYVYWRVKNSRKIERDPSFEHEIEISNIGPKKYQLKELKSATDNFNAKNELGRGGFGIVYKGKLMGEEVAVKRVWNNNKQGRKNMIAEVTTIGSVHHKNVVKLIGWCYEGDELLLVYEHMSNGSLDKLLFPEGNLPQSTLSWERRHKIVCGVAQSIDYLHNECSKRVLHRDIKTSNIMLNAQFDACLGDFGLARMFKITEKTHHTTIEIAGTRAYMAPELFHTGKATTESDVYAFGVLALEVICGRKPGTHTPDGELSNSIVDWVWELYRLDMICSAVDPKLKENYNVDEVECLLLVGLACCHPNPYTRPSIRSALQALMGEALPPLVPYEKPAFVWPTSAPLFTRELDRSFSGGISSFGSFSGRLI
ncbi:hypothetical protein V2J09_013765 [Rumex salicifolius]